MQFKIITSLILNLTFHFLLTNPFERQFLWSQIYRFMKGQQWVSGHSSMKFFDLCLKTESEWRLFPTVFFLTRLLKCNLTPYSAIFLCKATPAFVWRVPIQRNSGLKIRTTRATQLRCDAALRGMLWRNAGEHIFELQDKK